jgi:hypothetical protein
MRRYTSPLRNWEGAAAVRRHPSLSGPKKLDDRSALFSPALLLVCEHPIFVRRHADKVKAVQRIRLLQYLHYTECMELTLINPALQQLVTEPGQFEFPSELLVDAARIYTDEGAHALMSVALREQVGAGGPGFRPAYPSNLRELRSYLDGLPRRRRWLALLFAAATNEVLITSSIRQADDERLDPVIRGYIDDHARDEAVHHAFFVETLAWLWPAFSDEDREFLRRAVSYFLHRLVAPRPAEIESALVVAGVPADDAHSIIVDTYGPDRVTGILASDSAVARRALVRAGIFPEPVGIDMTPTPPPA